MGVVRLPSSLGVLRGLKDWFTKFVEIEDQAIHPDPLVEKAKGLERISPKVLNLQSSLKYSASLNDDAQSCPEYVSIENFP